MTLRYLASPITLSALVVLVVNDHLLKYAWPGPVTGKLSDVAGLVVLPGLVALLLTRVIRDVRRVGAAAIAITAAAFIAVKTSSAAAASVSYIMTDVMGPWMVRADPTDLLALPALLVAGWLWRRAAASPSQRRPLRRALTIWVALPLMVLGTAATSCGGPESIEQVHVRHRVLLAGSYTPSSMSTDGGLTWEPYYHETLSQQPLPQSHEMACLGSDAHHCFRAVGAPRVEESTDGGESWTVAWALPPDRVEFVLRQNRSCRGADIRARDVAIVPVDGSEHVVVALADEGVVVRTPDGDWHRVGVGEAQPAQLAEPFAAIGKEVGATGVAALVVLITSMIAAQLRMPPPRPGTHGAMVGAAVGVVGVGAVITVVVVLFSRFAGIPTGDAVGVGALGLACGVAGIAARTTGGQPIGSVVVAVLASTAYWLLLVLPFGAWSGGTVSYDNAVRLAVLLGVLGAPGVVVLTLSSLRWRHTPREL